eukprot:gene13760-13879_t
MDDESLLETVAAASVAHPQSTLFPALNRFWWPPAEFSALREPQLLLPSLPLPLRQQSEQDQLAASKQRFPSLMSWSSHHADSANLLAPLVAAQEWMQGRLAYRLQQVGTSPIWTKVLVLWLIALPFITIFGFFYHKAARVSLREAMYKVYALLYRVPGVGIAKEVNSAAYLVANTVFLAGVFSFAAVIGIVSDEVKVGIKNSRMGNYNMRLSDHILLLNWNSGSTALLRQIASAYSDGGMYNNGRLFFSNRPPVVVLADKQKAIMDAAVHEMLRDRGLVLEVHTREGIPYKLSDLRKVAAGKASTIIVLHPDEASSQANAEAIKSSIVMGLTALGSAPEQRVVVTGPVPTAAEQGVLHCLSVSSRLTGRSAVQVLELPDRQLMHRLIAQTAAQPGILTCWLDILALANNSAQFFCAELPASLHGKKYMEVRRAFANAVVCGYWSPDGRTVLNPSETDLPPTNSRLILLGRGGSARLMTCPSSQFYDNAAASAAERLERERTYKSKARNIIVTDWPLSTTLELMEGFSMFTPAGSQVTFLTAEEVPSTWPTRLGSCRFSFVTADNPTSAKVLSEAGIKTADAVVLGSGSCAAGGELESDARTLSAVLQVQDAVLASKRREAPHLVAPIKRYGTSKLASQYLDVLAAEQAERQAGSGLPDAARSSGGGIPVISSVLAALTSGSGAPKLDPAPAGGQQLGSGSTLAVICEPEFLVAQDVTSALITQVVSEPTYSNIMKMLLFSADGEELYLRNPASFNIPYGVALSFAEVEEAVRLTGQTALGYIRGRCSSSSGHLSNAISLKATPQKQQGDRARCLLGCGAAHTVTFGENDRIVVLAQDYNL